MHEDELYEVEWASGNTDVFADRAEAIGYYADDHELAAYAAHGGRYRPVAEVPAHGPRCVWSDAALAKIRARQC